MNVSFDFDGTLSKRPVQDFAKYCINQGLTVWIVTSRGRKGMHESYNMELFKIAESIGVDHSRIVFTEGRLKKDYFKHYPDFIFHLDDDWIDLHEIETHTEVKAIPIFGNSDWEQDCYNAIQKWQSN